MHRVGVAVMTVWWALVATLCLPANAQRPHAGSCTRIDLAGAVSAGQQWSAAIGEGWIFHLLPIHGARYSGWDLTVDRNPPTGYPDALLLATPPYRSINEREVGTTYGLRAQDALGWNPRSFHFFTSPADFREAQKLFAVATASVSSPAAQTAAMQKLADLMVHAAPGAFHILAARIVPGTADAAPFAENWGLQSTRIPRIDMAPAGGQPTPRGSLQWIHFSVALWLPQNWKVPKNLHAETGPCE